MNAPAPTSTTAERRASPEAWTWAAAGLGGALSVGLALYYRHAAAAHPASLGQGFPLDDAWIHAQFALNAAHGAPFQYNVGTFSSGSTAPLWSLVEGLLLAVTGDPVIAAHVLGVTFTALAAAMAVLLGRRLGLQGPALLAVPLLVASQWRLAWASVSGMEIPLAAALGAAALWLYCGERRGAKAAWRSGLLAGLLLWTRPEGGMVALLVMGLDQAVALASPGEARSRSTALRRAGGLLGAFAIVAAPLFAFDAAVGPGIFPQTVYVKAAPVSWDRGWSLVWTMLTSLAGDGVGWQLLLLGGAGYAAARSVATWRSDGGRLAVTLFAAGFVGAIAFVRGSGDYHDRYLMPCLPVLLVLGADGLARASRALRLGGWGALAGAVALAALAAPALREGAQTYALNVASVSGHVVAMGRWAARHLPRDATLAMSDVGAMSYFTPNRVVDMRGLVSPFHGWDRPEELERERRERVAYAILFPELNGRVILDGGYTPLHVITLDANNISATDNLVVYRTPWTDQRVVEPVGRAFDFEDGTLQGWEATGVLAQGPSEGAGPGQRAVVNLGGGRWFLSTWGQGGDGDEGRALSPPFEIEGDAIALRVGGGGVEVGGRVGVRLWVDGRIERTALGARSEVLVEREWDVRPLRGRVARIELFDDTADGWGHAMLDEVRQLRVVRGRAPALRDAPAEGPQEPPASRRAAEARGPGAAAPHP
jgi:hypothetical protein